MGRCVAFPTRSSLRSGRPLSPCGRAVRGKSNIAEAHLIWPVSIASQAWIDRWWLVDCRDLTTLENALGNEIGEPQDGDRDAVCPGRDTQQRISDHRGEELQADRVIVISQEPADLEMLLDPTKQQLDLPAAFVERGDLNGGTFEIIGQEGDRVALLALDAQAPQPDRQLQNRPCWRNSLRYPREWRSHRLAALRRGARRPA